MTDGRRARTIIFAFPFYDVKKMTDEAIEARATSVINVFTRLRFVKRVWVDTEKLREPLYIEVNLQCGNIHDKPIHVIEARLEKLLAKVYNFRECL